MTDYKIQLKATGALTQLPDSQKIFGAIVYMYAEEYGSDQASSLTKDIREKKLRLRLSSVMPDGYCPTPQTALVDKLSKCAENDTALKKKCTEIKERSYIPISQVSRVFKEPEDCLSLYPYIKLSSTQQLRASIESSTYDMPALESNLYSVPTVAVMEITKNQKDGERGAPVETYCFYLQMDESEHSVKLLRLLQNAANKNKAVVLGKRSSQGLNTFVLQSIIQADISCAADKHLYLNMGMLLPDVIDFSASSLHLFTSERRPFVMRGGWDTSRAKHFISYIAEGSVIAAPQGQENAGKSIVSPFQPERDIVFGNAFLFPLL